MIDGKLQTRSAANVLDNQVWLDHVDAVAQAADVPKGSIRIALVTNNDKKVSAALCVSGRSQGEERQFKRAVEAAVQQERFAELPTLPVKGHHNCHAHLCR